MLQYSIILETNFTFTANTALLAGVFLNLLLALKSSRLIPERECSMSSHE